MSTLEQAPILGGGVGRTELPPAGLTAGRDELEPPLTVAEGDRIVVARLACAPVLVTVCENVREFVAVAIAVGAYRDVPVIDDWTYAWSVERLLDDGRLEVIDWSAVHPLRCSSSSDECRTDRHALECAHTAAMSHRALDDDADAAFLTVLRNR